MLQLIKMPQHNCIRLELKEEVGIRGCHYSSFHFATPDTLEQFKLDQLVSLGGGRLAPTRKARHYVEDACGSVLRSKGCRGDPVVFSKHSFTISITILSSHVWPHTFHVCSKGFPLIKLFSLKPTLLYLIQLKHGGNQANI